MEEEEIMRYNPNRKDSDWDSNSVVGTIIGAIIAFCLGLCFLVVCSIFTSCKTIEYVPIVETHTDSIYITKHTRDSIYVQDSTHVSEKQSGDTITLTITKWSTKYIERTAHDTCYIATHDTVPKPYPKEVEVPAQLSPWQRFRMHMGGVALSIIAILAIYFLFVKRKI